MSPNILVSVTNNSGESPQTFRGMLLNFLGNVATHSGECPQTFRGILRIFGVNEENWWAESHLESCQTSTMELFCENSQTALIR